MENLAVICARKGICMQKLLVSHDKKNVRKVRKGLPKRRNLFCKMRKSPVLLGFFGFLLLYHNEV